MGNGATTFTRRPGRLAVGERGPGARAERAPGATAGNLDALSAIDAGLATPRERFDRDLAEMRSGSLPRFRAAVESLREGGVRTAGDEVVLRWIAIDAAFDELTAPPPPDAVAGHAAIRREMLAMLTLATGSSIAARDIPPEIDATEYAVEQVAQAAWVAKDTGDLVGRLGAPTLAESNQWTAIGLLRQHMNPWHFAFMTGTVRSRGLWPAFERFTGGPKVALAQVIGSQAAIVESGIAPGQDVGLVQLRPREGTVRLLQPMTMAEVAREVYGRARDERILRAYNPGLAGGGKGGWFPVGTEFAVDRTQVIEAYRPFFLAAEAAEREEEPAGSDPYIVPSTRGPAVPGNTITYSIRTPNSAFTNVSFDWGIATAPLTATEVHRESLRTGPHGFQTTPTTQDRSGRSAHLSWDVTFDEPGTYQIICLVSYSRTNRDLAIFPQLVMGLEDRTAIEFGRDARFLYSTRELLERLRERRDELPASATAEQRQALTDQINEIEEAVDESGGAWMQAVKAVYVSSDEEPIAIPLAIYVGSDPDHDLATSDHYRLKLWDFTLQSARTYEADGERPADALYALLEEFADDAPYPDGQIRFQITPGTLLYTTGLGFEVITHETDGGMLIDDVLRGFSMAALVIGAGASVLGAPEFGVPVIYLSGVLAGAASTFALADHLEHGDFEWGYETALNVLDIVSAAFTLGVASAGTTAVRGLGRATLMERVAAGTGYAQVGVIGAMHVSQISLAAASGDRERLTEAILRALGDGALFFVIHRVQRQAAATMRERAAARAAEPLRSTAGGTLRDPRGAPPSAPESAPAPEGTVYVEPGTPEYYRMHYEMWVSQQRTSGMRVDPVADPAPAPAPERPLREQTFDTPEQAYQMYDQVLARNRYRREAAIYRNRHNGRFAVREGTAFEVSGPSTEQWDTIVHFHPNPRNVLTLRMPAPRDFQQPAAAARGRGHAVMEIVEHPLPGGRRGRVIYTAHPDGRLSIEFERPNGSRVTRNFDDIHDYARAYDSRTRFVDPESAEYNWMRDDLNDFYGPRDPGGEPGAATRTAGGTARPPRAGSQVETEARAESMAHWSGRETDTSFARHGQTFYWILRTLRNKFTALRAAGQARLMPVLNESVVDMPVDEFIRRTPALRRRLAELRARARDNPYVQQQLNEFLATTRGGSGNVGARKPDIVEFFLAEGNVVVTDISVGMTDVHFFKTEFYRAVLRAMFGGRGPRVYGVDINPTTAVPETRVTPDPGPATGGSGVQPKLRVSQEDDPDERDADRLAARFIAGDAAAGVTAGADDGRVQRACATCDETIQRQGSGPAPEASEPGPLPESGGQPLAPAVRAPYEQFFGADLARVRVHDDGAAHEAAAGYNARALTHGQDVYFGRGEFSPDTSGGQELIAHELAHTVQNASGVAGTDLRRQPAPAQDAVADAAAINLVGALALASPVAVLGALKGRSVAELQALRLMAIQQTGIWLEQWLVARLGRGETSVVALLVAPVAASALSRIQRAENAREAAAAEDALQVLWPALPVVDQMLVYDEGYREIEQAQVDVLRNATDAQRAAARQDPRLPRILAALDPKEEYEARLLLDPSDASRYTAAERVLERESKDALFDAMLALPPANRKRFLDGNYRKIYRLLSLWQLTLVASMVREVRDSGRRFGGSEVDALIARLKLGKDSIQDVMDRALELLRERQQLRALRRAPDTPEEQLKGIDARIDELRGLDRLFEFQRSGDDLSKHTFLGQVANIRDDPGAFGNDVQRLLPYIDPLAARQFLLRAAEQRIVMAAGDVDAIRAVLFTTHAPPVTPAEGATRADVEKAQLAADIEFRKELIARDIVRGIVRKLVGSEQMKIPAAVEADRYAETRFHLHEAVRSGRTGDVFRLTLKIARDPGWKWRFENSKAEFFGTWAIAGFKLQKVMRIILDTREMPLVDVLQYTGDVDDIRAAFSEIPESQRSMLRRGWALVHDPPYGPLTLEDQRALDAYKALQDAADVSQEGLLGPDRGGLLEVMRSALGTAPSERELNTPEGRWAAAALMYEQQKAQLDLERGASADFTEADETMVAAAREFGARWLPLQAGSHALSMIDYAALYALNQRFLTRSKEFEAASNAIGEMAAMIASTVAGVLIVVATGGAAGPAVIALAATAGAGARIVTREMFGAEYYKAQSSESAREGLLGAIDGALAVFSGRLAARGAELLGFSGGALTRNASKLAGAAAEAGAATLPKTLGQKVAGGAVEAAIDGLLSGAVTEAVGTFADEATWRRGIMDGLVRVGQSAITGGLVGLGTGGLVGGALPVAAAGAGRLWHSVAGDSVQKALAGAGEAQAYQTARSAARGGNIDEAMRVAKGLESHLSADQVLAMRRQLFDDFHGQHGFPPGTARAQTPDQERLLMQSGRLDDGLTDAQVQAETDIVARSRPQPATETGFVDQVDLGNGHTWRRKRDGTWCRFTKKTKCGTQIPNAVPLTVGTDPAILRVQQELAQKSGRAALVEELVKDPQDLFRRVSDGRPRGQLTINTTRVTKEEADILEELIEKDLAEMTPADVRQVFEAQTRLVADPRGGGFVPQPTGKKSPAEKLRLAMHEAVTALQREEEILTSPLYQRLRAGSPGTTRSRNIRSSRVDFVNKAHTPMDQLAADHIVALRQIYDMPGFIDLARKDFDKALAIANYADNLKPVNAGVNKSRQERSWAMFRDSSTTWSPRYTVAQMNEMVKEEMRLRPLIEAEIRKALGKP